MSLRALRCKELYESRSSAQNLLSGLGLKPYVVFYGKLERESCLKLAQKIKTFELQRVFENQGECQNFLSHLKIIVLKSSSVRSK